MSEVKTPYFLDTDGTVRNGQNLIVFEPEDYDLKELQAMLGAVNEHGYLQIQIANAQNNADAAARRIAVLEDALVYYANPEAHILVNGLGQTVFDNAENATTAIKALAESKRIGEEAE